MSRYFFDTDESGKVLIDEDGVELPNIDEAEKEALATLGHIAKDRAGRCRYVAMNVRDEAGTVLLTAALSLQVERRV